MKFGTGDSKVTEEAECGEYLESAPGPQVGFVEREEVEFAGSGVFAEDFGRKTHHFKTYLWDQNG